MQSLLNLYLSEFQQKNKEHHTRFAPEHVSCVAMFRSQHMQSFNCCDRCDNVECAEIKTSLLVLAAPEDRVDEVAQPILAARKDVSVLSQWGTRVFLNALGPQLLNSINRWSDSYFGGHGIRLTSTNWYLFFPTKSTKINCSMC